MKKIGILTFCSANNYGAQLQLLSLINIITSKGFSVTAIDFNVNNYGKINRHINFLIRKLLNKESVLFDKFRREYVNIDYLHNINELNNYDCVIVGSDQIWNYDITMSDTFLLPIKLRGLKVSYGASIGKKTASSLEMDMFSKYLLDFDFVSVRESELRLSLLKIREDVKEVLDPVFFLTDLLINNVIAKSRLSVKKEFILVYMLEYNDSLIKQTKVFEENYGIKSIFVVPDRNITVIQSTYKTGPTEFLYLMKNAKYVITNSFHGLALSIIMKKNFSIFPHSSRNDRISNLLSITGLDNLLSTNSSLLMNNINFAEVDRLIDIRKESSLTYIDNFLRAVEQNE